MNMPPVSYMILFCFPLLKREQNYSHPFFLHPASNHILLSPYSLLFSVTLILLRILPNAALLRFSLCMWLQDASLPIVLLLHCLLGYLRSSSVSFPREPELIAEHSGAPHIAAVIGVNAYMKGLDWIGLD